MPTPHKQRDFGNYSDPLADPRGVGYTSIGRMDTQTADNAADVQRDKDVAKAIAEQDRREQRTSTKTWAIILTILLAGPVIVFLMPWWIGVPFIATIVVCILLLK